MPARTRRRVAAVLLLAALGACTSDRDPAELGAPDTTAASTSSTLPPIRTLAMIGDSITNGSEVELREQLAGLDVEIQMIDAEDGRRLTSDGFTNSGLQAINALRARAEPDLWIVALGTNDVGQYEGAEGYGPVIEEVLAALPDDAPLVWVDVYLEASPESSAVFNATLRELLAERGNAAVVDWGNLADEDGVLRDGIHPSGYGIDRFAELVTAAVARHAAPRN